MSNAGFLLLLVIPILIAIPLIVYHLLIFPNLQGVMLDLSIYNVDSDSQHYLYWLGFWFSGGVGAVIGVSAVKSS